MQTAIGPNEFLVSGSFPHGLGSASGDDAKSAERPPAAMILMDLRTPGLCSKKYGFQCAATDGVLDVPLRDLRVRCPWSPNRVRVNVRRADAAGLRLRPMRQEDAS
jgi:hypothetical protein